MQRSCCFCGEFNNCESRVCANCGRVGLMAGVSGELTADAIFQAARDALFHSKTFSTYFWILVVYAIVDFTALILMTKVIEVGANFLSVSISLNVGFSCGLIGAQVCAGWQLGAWLSCNAKILAMEALSFKDGFQTSDLKGENVLICVTTMIGIVFITYLTVLMLAMFGFQIDAHNDLSPILIGVLNFGAFWMVCSPFTWSGYFQEKLFYPNRDLLTSLNSVMRILKGHYWAAFRFGLKLPKLDQSLPVFSQFKMLVSVIFLSATVFYIALQKRYTERQTKNAV